MTDDTGPGWLDSQVSMPPTRTPLPGWRRCAVCQPWHPRDDLRAIRPRALACRTCRTVAEHLDPREIDDWLAWPDETKIYAIRTKHNIDPDSYEHLPSIRQTTASLTGAGVGHTSGGWGFHVPECFWDHYKRKPWTFTVPDFGDED